MDQQQDYDRFLAEFGFKADEVRRVVENTDDQVPMPAGFEHVQVRESLIQGKGAFTARALQVGDVVGPARLDGMRTPVGRYANHSRHPNARFEANAQGDIHAIAFRPMQPDEEITVDYRQAAKVNGWDRQPSADEVIRTIEMRGRAG